MSRRITPRKRAHFKRVYHRTRNRVYKQATSEIATAFRKERKIILEAVHGSLTAQQARANVKAIMRRAHGEAAWRATLDRVHRTAAVEGANMTIEVMGLEQAKTYWISGYIVELKQSVFERIKEPIVGFFRHIAGYIKGRAEQSTEIIEGTTEAALNEVLDQAVADELTPEEIATLIGEKYDQWEGTRSAYIAVSEVTGPFGEGSRNVVDELNAAKYKVWCCSFLPNSREWHMDADEQTVPIDEPFIVMGEELMEPGDFAGSSDNIDNCQCWADYTDEAD